MAARAVALGVGLTVVMATWLRQIVPQEVSADTGRSDCYRIVSGTCDTISAGSQDGGHAFVAAPPRRCGGELHASRRTASELAIVSSLGPRPFDRLDDPLEIRSMGPAPVDLLTFGTLAEFVEILDGVRP